MKGQTWLILGGFGAAAVVLFIAANQSSSQQNNSSGIVPTSAQFPTTNAGTPTANDSLVGFIDPQSGIQWVLNSGTEMLSNGQIVTSGVDWTATLPAGMLPPNYQPGQAFIIPALFPSPTTVSGSNA